MMENTPASISELVKKVQVTNLVPDILRDQGDVEGQQTLDEIAKRVIDDRNADRKSMESWAKFVEAGRKLAQQELEGKSEPWDNAANFKSPAPLEACLKFGDRASATLLKPRDLVKYDVVGPDKEGEKQARGVRITEHMNYQLNYSMKTWRDDHDALMYVLPSDGAAFKYTYYDATEGENCAEVVRFPDFAVNQANTSMEKCRSFTIDREFSKSDVLSRLREGVWHEYPDLEMGTETQQEQSEEAESDEKFFIQQMFYDLDDDGYEEPYLAVVHERTEKVVRLVPRFELGDIWVRTPNGKVVTLDKVIDGQDELGFDVPSQDATDKERREATRLSQCELVRIEPINCITQYTFIPGSLLPFEEGSFLGLGYCHLLAALTQAINSSSNTILNAGKLVSTPGGFLAKGFQKAKGVIKYKIGQFIPTMMSAADLQNSVREFNFKDVSQGFYNFNDKMRAEIERIAASADLTEAIGANAPATTMLGMVQEQMMPVSSLISRVYRAQKQEFMKLAQLNQKYTDPALYKELVGNDEANFQEDYALLGVDVAPAANPEMTSKIQNMLQASAALEQFDKILQAGGNPVPLLEQYLEGLGNIDLQKVFPDEDQESEPDPKLVALREQLGIERELAQAQVQVAQGDLRNKQIETAIKYMKTKAEIKEMLSKVVLNLEKAESEHAKNAINAYTAELEGMLAIIEKAEAQDGLAQMLPAPQ